MEESNLPGIVDEQQLNHRRDGADASRLLRQQRRGIAAVMTVLPPTGEPWGEPPPPYSAAADDDAFTTTHPQRNKWQRPITSTTDMVGSKKAWDSADFLDDQLSEDDNDIPNEDNASISLPPEPSLVSEGEIDVEEKGLGNSNVECIMEAIKSGDSSIEVLPDLIEHDYKHERRLPRQAGTSLSLASFEKDTLSEIHKAACSGTIKLLEKFIRNGEDINVKDTQGRTPLMYAIIHNQTTALKFLLKSGADANVSTNKGARALHHAAFEGRYTAVSTLLAAGACADVIDNEGRAPIHWCAGADVDINAQRCSALLITDGGVDINMRDSGGLTALQWAAFYNKPYLLNWLIKHGADVTSSDMDGKTAAHRAVHKGDKRCLVLISSIDVEVAQRRDKSGRLVLHYAAQAGALEAVLLLCALNPGNIDAIDNNGRTALHWASASGQSSVCCVLLEAGADTMLADNNGGTPLHYALISHHHECVKTLMNIVDCNTTTMNKALKNSLSASTVGDSGSLSSGSELISSSKNTRVRRSSTIEKLKQRAQSIGLLRSPSKATIKSNNSLPSDILKSTTPKNPVPDANDVAAELLAVANESMSLQDLTATASHEIKKHRIQCVKPANNETDNTVADDDVHRALQMLDFDNNHETTAYQASKGRNSLGAAVPMDIGRSPLTRVKNGSFLSIFRVPGEMSLIQKYCCLDLCPVISTDGHTKIAVYLVYAGSKNWLDDTTENAAKGRTSVRISAAYPYASATVRALPEFSARNTLRECSFHVEVDDDERRRTIDLVARNEGEFKMWTEAVRRALDGDETTLKNDSEDANEFISDIDILDGNENTQQNRYINEWMSGAESV